MVYADIFHTFSIITDFSLPYFFKYDTAIAVSLISHCIQIHELHTNQPFHLPDKTFINYSENFQLIVTVTWLSDTDPLIFSGLSGSALVDLIQLQFMLSRSAIIPLIKIHIMITMLLSVSIYEL